MDYMTALIVGLLAALVLHLVEEVRTGFRFRLPFGEMPRRVFMCINIALYGFILATVGLSATGSGFARPFAWAFALAMLLNGAGHIGWMVVRRAYFPGGLSAFVLVGVALALVWHLS